MIRGIDTQIVAAKPADQTSNQSHLQKQSDLQMQHAAAANQKNAEIQKERAAAVSKGEHKRIGDQERERGQGRERGKSGNQKQEQDQQSQDPLLSLAVEKGKYAKKEHHFIDLKL
jgi:hypothetical protein